MQTDHRYDIVIIGSGLGGLLCANILALQGFKICVLEKNRQFGGNLQTFARDKKIFDTGVHYIGGLDQGQNLYQIFKYVGLMEQLKLERMERVFDKILIGDDPTIYGQTQGYAGFVESLSRQFPHEAPQIRAYCDKVQATCASFPLYNLELDTEAPDLYQGNNENARQVIASFTQNQKLQSVLAGNNLLYAGQADCTPFHVHALITNSYIESSWKCIGGGSQIAKILAANLRRLGGVIIRNATVVAFERQKEGLTHVRTEAGAAVCGDRFISNVHPATTLDMLGTDWLKPLYRKRITGLAQTVGSFSVHLVLEERTVAYEGSNYYYHQDGQLWHLNDYDADNWPLGYGLYFTEDRQHPGFAGSVSILTPMRFEDVAPWAATHNRVAKEQPRGAAYESFKADRAATLLRLVGQRFPRITRHIKRYYTSTPLTNRDYIGDPQGSMYGIQKDYRDPLQTMVSPRTKIPNLFLTGQNLNLHGILGTSLSAVLTCMMLTGDKTLITAIKNA